MIVVSDVNEYTVAHELGHYLDYKFGEQFTGYRSPLSTVHYSFRDEVPIQQKQWGKNFNEFVGGPAHGYKYLDDSNLEWGQDVKRLAEYQREHPETKVVYPWQAIDLAYYGVVDNQFDRTDAWYEHPSGRYAVSMFFLTRAQATSRLKNVPALDWLARYDPSDRIGYSYFIYDF